MVRTILGFVLGVVAALPSLSLAQSLSDLTPDQKGYITYDHCVMSAAIQASYTTAKNEEIFGLARAQCAATRAQVVIGQEDNRQYLAALDAADANKATNFPAWIKGVRERRQARNAASAVPSSTPPR
jgi:hypothetical protein